jgi:predicted nucleic acid-binding protein
MILVIDANILIAALIKTGKTGEIIVSGKFKLVSPNFIREEVHKYRDYIRQKAHLDQDGFDILLELLYSKITILPTKEYASEIPRAIEMMKEDIKDSEYVACYFALKCDGIWTNDPHFDDKRELKIIKTEYLLKLL